jgi:hypothetical protein
VRRKRNDLSEWNFSTKNEHCLSDIHAETIIHRCTSIWTPRNFTVGNEETFFKQKVSRICEALTGEVLLPRTKSSAFSWLLYGYIKRLH